jgi:hypothetical protein
LNYPIRFVSVTGPVVAIDDILKKFVLITIDDGSGQTIVIRVDRLPDEVTASIDCPANTAVSNVNVYSGLGWMTVTVDDIPLDIGSVLTAKCTITEYREEKQLQLQRVSLVQTTDEEVSSWAAMAKYKAEVLSKPWVLSQTALDRFNHELEAEEEKTREKHLAYQAKKQESTAKKAEKETQQRERNNKREMKRQKLEAAMNAGALI